MAEVSPEGAEVNARVVYWGVQGAGKTANLEMIHAKLRADNRGELSRVPTRIDPTVSYEMLPMELGELGGVRTRIQIVAVPGGADQAPTRKQLLDRVDGVVFVIDAQRDRIEENLASFAELRRALASYGRTLADVPIVLQYNKRDLADPYALEELHRKLDMRGAAAFEAVASEGTAVLPTLTTISKRVVRFLRERPAPPQSTAAPAPNPPPGVSQVLDLALASPATAAQLQASTQAAAPPVAPEGPGFTAPEAPVAAVPAAAAPPAAVAELEVAPVAVAASAAPAREPTLEPEAAGSPASILAASYSPEADAVAATTQETRELLDPGFDSLRQEFEVGAEGDKELAGFGDFVIETVGRASVVGEHGIRMPVLLRNERGQALPVKLTLLLEPDAEGGD